MRHGSIPVGGKKVTIPSSSNMAREFECSTCSVEEAESPDWKI